MKVWIAFTAAIVSMILCSTVYAADRQEMPTGIRLRDTEMNVVGQGLGNSDIVLVRVGLAEPNNVASWGLAVAHKPETATIDQSTSFGLWGAVSTEIQLAQPGTLGLWAGLTAKPFLDVDVLYDFDNRRISVWPGAGARIAPTKTLSFVARAVYPLGDEDLPAPVDYNTFTGLFGLQIEF